MSTNPQDGSRFTVVLVHGAFADASSWNARAAGLTNLYSAKCLV